MVPGTDPPARSCVGTAALAECWRRQISIEGEDPLVKGRKRAKVKKRKLRQLVSGGAGRKEASHHDEKVQLLGWHP